MPRHVAESWTSYLGPGAASSLALALASSVAGLGVPVLVRVRQVLRHARLDERRVSDAILILGRHLEDDRPSAMFRARLDHALALFREGVAERLIVTGGLTGTARRTEADAGREYLVARGADPAAIECEDESRHTLENLFNVRRRALARGWSRFLLVSDPLHMARALALARGLRLDVACSPAPPRPPLVPGSRHWWQRALREAALLHWYHVGMAYSRAIGSQRLLSRVT